MNKFYFTFGVQYAYNPHPVNKKANPNGWVEVVATDEFMARKKMCDHYGQYWAFVYEEKPDVRMYPLGCIDSL